MAPPSSSTLPLSPSSTSSQPQTPTATSSFTRLLDPPCLNFIAPRIDPLLPPDLSAIDLRSLKFKNHLVEASFRLSQACLSVTRARTISLALALTNLLYSLADLLRLEPYSKVFWFTLCSRTVGSTLLIMIVYLLLHCVSNELSVRINDCASTFDLFTDPETIKQDEQNKGQRNRGVSFDESLSLENGSFHAPRTRCTRKLSNLRHFAAIFSGTLKRPLLGSEQNSSYAGSSRSSGLNETRVQVDNPSPIPYTESQLNEPPPKTKIPQSCFSILLPQLVTSQNYPFFVVPTTIILSLVGSLSLYLYPDNGSQYLICLSLVIYWTIHHASFTIPWQFAVCASVIVSIPVTTVVLQLPVIYRQEPQKTVCVLAVVYVALVYANYFHELQSRQMFWLLEKAKADKSTVEKAVVMNSTNEAKSEFIANVSHEMRTPLSAVICASSLLMDGNLTSDEVLHLAKIVHATSETLSVLINDVLDFASCEANRLSLRPSPISLADLANDTISCLAPGFALKRLDLACHVDTRLWYHKVICDGSRLNQILVNLLNNGMKFTSTGGVSLNMDVVSYDTINYPQTATVHICIEDSGMGIPADAISQLGGRFYQVESGAKKPTGTGLGLFISRALIENMGSHWEVTSNVGQGTKFEFTLTLPLASAGDSFENRVLSNTASDLEDVLKAFTPEDEPSRWYCLVIGGSVLGRRSFLNHLEDLKVAMVEDATPDEWKEDTPMNSVQSHASSPMPSSSAASKSLDYEHRVSSSDNSIKYRGLRFRIREFVRRVRNVDPYGIPILFADECFVPQNLGLDPLKKHGANGVAVLDRSFDLEKWGSDSEDPSSPLEGPRVRMQEDEEDHEIATFLFPIQVRHRLYNDKSAESFSRSSSRGMARPLFAEAATTMEYEDHVRDLGNQQRSSYCSTDTISSRSKRGSVSTDTFVSPLFWAPLNKPITAGGIAKTMKTAFTARAMWQKPTTHPLSPVPSPDLVDGHEISSAAALREGSRRPPGEQAGETLWTTPRNASAIAGADTRVSPNPRRSSLRGKTLSETTVPESVVPKRPRVLVAEDNAVIVALVTRILAIAGFKADFATDGEMALKMFEDSIDSHGSSYGAIMMDVRMDRMDGVTCAKRIRQLQKSRGIRNTPILGTTGEVLELDGEEFPFDEVLPKPYDRARLVNALRECVERNR